MIDDLGTVMIISATLDVPTRGVYLTWLSLNLVHHVTSMSCIYHFNGNLVPRPPQTEIDLCVGGPGNKVTIKVVYTGQNCNKMKQV